MGDILSVTERDDGKKTVEIVISKEEVLQLKGCMNNIRLFAEEEMNVKSRLVQRGKNEATQYFLIPKEHRSQLNHSEKATCQRIDIKGKVFFIFSIEKKEEL